jgi:TPR repeat protein
MAAESGEADAQFTVGALYARGEGVPKRLADAVHWFSKRPIAGI